MAIGRRTTTGKALAAWRSELLTDLGGIETVSTPQRCRLDSRNEVSGELGTVSLIDIGLREATQRPKEATQDLEDCSHQRRTEGKNPRVTE
jgi:hypothetical protein